MFILRDKIRQNLRKYYNTTKTKKKGKKEINYGKFLFFQRPQLQFIIIITNHCIHFLYSILYTHIK